MKVSVFTVILAITPLILTGCLGDFETSVIDGQEDQSRVNDPPAENEPTEIEEPEEQPSMPEEEPSMPEEEPSMPEEEPSMPEEEPSMPEEEPSMPEEEPSMPGEEPSAPTSATTLGPQPITGTGSEGDYYVSPSGSDSNSGTKSQPFKTIAKAASLARPGDLIYIRGGTYGGLKLTSIQGNSNAPITFRAYPGETPILDGAIKSYEGMVVLLYGDNRYLTFDGLTITDSRPEVEKARQLDLSQPADLSTFKSVYLPKLSTYFLMAVRISPSDKKDSSGKRIDKPSHITFRNTTITKVGDMAMSVHDAVHNFTVENSLIYNTGYPKSSYGVYTHGNNFTFRNNIVHDLVYGLHIYGKGSTNTGTVIENNYFYNIGLRYYWHKASSTVKSGGTGVLVDDPGSGARIVNNIIRDCSMGISASMPDVIVAHNLIYKCKTGLSVSDSGVGLYNNAVHSNNTNFNFAENPKTNKSTVTSASVVLMDNAKPERGLASDTAVKDKGVYVEGVLKDILGRTRDGAPDVGPFEQ